MQKNDGIIIMDKPQGFTSFDMVAKMRGMLGTRKVGHAGTLDPMATGVLPIFVGRATKCCDLLPDQDKSYTATFELGYTTDTLDATGKLLSRQPVTAGEEQVRAVLERFRGPISQLPPMYSAISIGGKRLYDLARQGIEVERERRPVTIHSLELTDAQPQENRYTIEVSCSKGTYIRTLCADIGEALGCGATMTALRRTCAAGFSLEDALTLEQAQQLAEQGTLRERMLPIERVFSSLPKLQLGGKQEQMYRNGVHLDLARLEGAQSFAGWQGDVAVFGEGGVFLGLSCPDWESHELRLHKLFAIQQL